MNQCDGCAGHVQTYEREGVTYHRMGPGDLMICQAHRYAPEPGSECPPGHSCIRCYPPKPWQQERLGGAYDADFASLLEREPQDMSRPSITQDPGCNCAGEAWPGAEPSHAVDCASHDVGAGIDWQQMYANAQKTSESQAARISSLEGVLREIRGKVNDMSRLMPDDDAKELDAIEALIRETLDPHKPWCRDENHQGPCLSDPEERDDGE